MHLKVFNTIFHYISNILLFRMSFIAENIKFYLDRLAN
jgi:hypothetical protein